MYDLASVSMTVRSVSNNVRRRPATVSSNVRQKQALIARRAVHHCASLHLPVRLVGDLPFHCAYPTPRRSRPFGRRLSVHFVGESRPFGRVLRSKPLIRNGDSASEIGLEAQRAAIGRFVGIGGFEVIDEFRPARDAMPWIAARG
jgi:hypothetical protein